MTVYTDDFTYADGLLSNQADWATPFDTSLSVASNNLSVPSATVGYNVFQTAIAADSFCEVVGHLGDTAEYGEFNCFVRCDNSAETFYRADYNTAGGTGEVTLHRVVNGAYTDLRSITGLGVDTNDHRLRLEAVTMSATAVRLRVWWDGVLLIDFSDVNAARLTTGSYVGIGIYRTTTLSPEITDWSAGDATSLHKFWQDFTGLSNQALSAVTDWTTYQVSGSGVMSIDTGHAAAYSPSVDFSAAPSSQLAMYGQALDSDHHYAECDVMLDRPSQASDNNNFAGPIVRGSQATATATLDGYTLVLRNRYVGQFAPEVNLILYRIDNGAMTQIGPTLGDLGNNGTGEIPGEEELVHRVRLEVNGSRLFGYVNGKLYITHTDTTYATGSYCGVYAQRGEGSTGSQPWWDNWAAGDLPIIYVGRALKTGSTTGTSTISKPTGTVEGDLMIGVVTFYDVPSISPPAGWTLIATLLDTDTNFNTRQGIYWKVAGASEPTSYSWTHDSSSTHGSITTLRPNTAAGFAWPANPIESYQKWGANSDNASMEQPGATTVAAMAFGVGLDSGFSGFTPGNNAVAEWTLIGTTDSNWHGVFIRQFDAAATYPNVSHNESENNVPPDPALATTVVVAAQEVGWEHVGVTEAYDNTGGAVTSITANRTATAGNLLVAAVAIDKDSGTITDPASNWTLIHKNNSASASTAIYWRVATGDTNDNFTLSWATAVGNANALVGEWEVPAGVTPSVVVNTGSFSETADTGKTVNPGAAAEDGLLIAWAYIDTDKVGGVSFTGVTEHANSTGTRLSGFGQSVGAFGSLPVATSGAQSVTSLWGGADQNGLRIFKFASAGGLTAPGAVSDLACAPSGANISLTWTAPSDGGSAITDYLVYVGEVQTFT